jgi:hypothetical protein
MAIWSSTIIGDLISYFKNGGRCTDNFPFCCLDIGYTLIKRQQSSL